MGNGMAVRQPSVNGREVTLTLGPLSWFHPLFSLRNNLVLTHAYRFFSFILFAAVDPGGA